jgi:hypothetical protein
MKNAKKLKIKPQVNVVVEMDFNLGAFGSFYLFAPYCKKNLSNKYET